MAAILCNLNIWDKFEGARKENLVITLIYIKSLNMKKLVVLYLLLPLIAGIATTTFDY